MPSTLSKTTRDHEEIRKWAEARGGKPSHVKRTGSGGDVGILRIDFPGYSGEGSLEPISWDEWFEKFDENNLALIYEEETAGGQRSNFNKLVSAETAAASESGRSKKKPASRKASKKAASGGRASQRSSTGSKKTGARKSAAKVAAKKAGRKTTAKKTSAKKKATKSSARKTTGRKASAKKRR